MRNILSGDGIYSGEMMSQVQDNIRFRVQSAREMLTGIRDDSAMSPLQRRREIRNRRMSLVGMGSASMDGNGGDSGSSGSSSNRISQSSTSHGASMSDTVSDDVPSMSEVGSTTKTRARNMGYSSSD
ncbi:MAG: hypothetical protein J07AB43_01490 [Candidatus Nanosalina sp. J07AB43]|jgi:hypothetical protein|nr:MAG: hypothetical protein J07AB43_01490 [Candidatus Nanosalina sp. J07AB43]